MDIITLSELNRTVLECLVRLNYLCSLGTDEAIKNSLNIHSSPRAEIKNTSGKNTKSSKIRLMNIGIVLNCFMKIRIIIYRIVSQENHCQIFLRYEKLLKHLLRM